MPLRLSRASLAHLTPHAPQVLRRLFIALRGLCNDLQRHAAAAATTATTATVAAAAASSAAAVPPSLPQALAIEHEAWNPDGSEGDFAAGSGDDNSFASVLMQVAA